LAGDWFRIFVRVRLIANLSDIVRKVAHQLGQLPISDRCVDSFAQTDLSIFVADLSHHGFDGPDSRRSASNRRVTGIVGAL